MVVPARSAGIAGRVELSSADSPSRLYNDGLMICPVCRIEMIAVERHGIEVDFCISCRGFWFDHGELDLLAEITGTHPADLSGAPTTGARRDRRCPRCDKPLDEVVHASTRLDRCPGGDGIWFDRGELGQIVHRVAESHGALSPVTEFLGEVFSVPAEGSSQHRVQEESQP